VFLQRLQLALLLCVSPLSSLLLIADGARSLRNFFTESLADLKDKTMLLDWHHVEQKCYELSSSICKGKTAKARLLRWLYRRLWHGDVVGAIAVLHSYRPQARNTEVLERLIAYLRARQPRHRELSAAAHRAALRWQRPCRESE
jgi:hypothetical protein